MTNKYIVAIDAEIIKVKERLHDLEGMKRFMLALDKQTPASTKKAVVYRGPQVQKMLITNITAVLDTADARPMFSQEIIDGLTTMFGWAGKKQRVWAALSVMKKQGLVRHNDGLYSLQTNGKPNVSQAKS